MSTGGLQGCGAPCTMLKIPKVLLRDNREEGRSVKEGGLCIFVLAGGRVVNLCAEEDLHLFLTARTYIGFLL